MDFNSLREEIFKTKSFLCVGLDPDWDKIPSLAKGVFVGSTLLNFNSKIIDATANYCVAYKLNMAFYECFGIEGLHAFESTVKYLQMYYPNKFVIADAKRGDIGNTSKKYAKAFFEQYGVDALTVAPYMGEDSVKPFLEYEDK